MPDSSWAISIILGIVSICLIAVNAGKILNYVFLFLTVSIALLFYIKRPIFYVGFTWWIWFLSPLVRRLADYRGGGFSEQSLILLTPYLVTLISGMTLAKSFKRRLLPESIPFLICLLAVGYSYIVGVLNAPLFKSSFVLLNWITPMVFGYHLLASWQSYPAYSKNIQRVFLWCLIIAGSYGVYQYLLAPEWDCSWLVSVDGGAGGFGQPFPQKIRVWSIMHGPGVFAAVMAACLILTAANLNLVTAPASVVGYLALLLTVVRSAWIAWAVGFFTVFLRLTPKAQGRILLSGLIIGALLIPLSGMEQFSDLISRRLQSFSSLESDGSGQERLAVYERAVSFVTTNFVGTGLGGDHSQFAFDSGILDILVNLGWIGAVPYLFGMFLILQRILVLNIPRTDSFAISARAVTLAILAQLPFGSSMVGLPGLLLWSFFALSMASIRYHSYSLFLDKLAKDES
jgi:O-Antigen ligase